MTPRQIFASLIIGVSVLVVILYLIRKRRLEIAYSLLWLGVGLTTLGVVIKYDWLRFLSHLIGAEFATTTLFLLAIIFIFLLCLQFSIVLSKHSTEIRRLTQELALLRVERGLPLDIYPSSAGEGALPCAKVEIDTNAA